MKRRTRIFRNYIPLVALAWLAIQPMAASAANNQSEAVFTCDARAMIIDGLTKGYSEQPVALGVTNAGTVMELWTASNGDTWTLVVTMGNGDSCVVGAGDGWTSIKKTAKGKIL